MNSFAALAAVVAALFLIGCSGDDTLYVRGQVVAVEASAIIEWESLTLRTDDGRELTFLRGEKVDLLFWRASHLREHSQTGEAIVVFYESTGQGLVAQSIEDRP